MAALEMYADAYPSIGEAAKRVAEMKDKRPTIGVCHMW